MLGRLLLGLSFLMYGLVRIAKLPVFRAGLVQEFAAAPLPPALVGAYASALPFVEGSIGVLLGLFTRPALVAAMLVVMNSVFGSSLLEKWSFVGDQLLYELFIIMLVLHLQRNHLCLDALALANEPVPGQPASRA